MHLTVIYTAANAFAELKPVLTQANFTLCMKHWKILIEKATGRSYKQRTLEKYGPVKFKTVILFQVIVRISTPDSHPADFSLLLVPKGILQCLTRLLWQTW